MGGLLSGSSEPNSAPNSSRRNNAAANNSGSMGNLINGDGGSQPSSARSYRQAPGGTSSIVIG